MRYGMGRHYSAVILHNDWNYFSEVCQEINIPTARVCQSLLPVPPSETLKFPHEENSPWLGIPVLDMAIVLYSGKSVYVTFEIRFLFKTM